MIKILYIFTSCKKSGPIQQMLNLIKNLDRSEFEPFLVTIYPENTEGLSVLDKYLPYVRHRHIHLGKAEILAGRCGEIRRFISEYSPDVIHTLGVFPDYLVYRLGFKNHVLTARNFVFDDYPDEYGKIMGNMLAKIHLRAICGSEYSRVCSESLHKIYKERLGLDIPFIRNGVDISAFSVPSSERKAECRKIFGIPEGKTVWVYGGAYNGRKNQEFLLSAVTQSKYFSDSVFLLPGDGKEYARLKEKYDGYDNIIMPGNVLNMVDYLAASDIYLSTSKSEGMPNGVLEAMACGLPVLLSDIEQHNEIINAAEGFGLSYKKDDIEDFIHKFDIMFENHILNMGIVASLTANKHFSSVIMCKNYQKLYKLISSESRVTE